MIFRIQKTNNYVVLDKGFLQNAALSWQAKGLLAYMLQLPDDWQFNVEDLKNRSTNGRDATRSTIQELEKAGYIIKEQTRQAGRFNKVDYVVLETPHISGKPAGPGGLPFTENPSTDNPPTENPSTENPTLVSNNLLSNKTLSNKKDKDNVADAPPAPKAEAPDLPFKDVIEYLNLTAGTAYRPSSKKTQSLIKARISDGFGVEDFKKVVDIKTKTWGRDKQMATYLRPETLFGTKFESYLNEWRLKNGVNQGRTAEKSNLPKDVGF